MSNSEDAHVPESKEDAIEFVKPKKKTCRRGKKRKYKSPTTVTSGSPIAESGEMYWNSETAECRKSAKNVLIRPVDAPKAPKNSTQFIIDDHDECHLYFSFEKSYPHHTNNTPEPNSSVDAAFQDIDYVYHSMYDGDSSAYYLEDFEESYSNVRYEELSQMPKPELIAALENLDGQIKEIESKLYERDPLSALEQLQRKLLQLQEENSVLHKMNDHLQGEIRNVEPGNPHDVQPDAAEHSLSEDSQSDSDDSCEGCEECCRESESHEQSFPACDNSVICNMSHSSPIYYNRYKDLSYLAIDESHNNSCDDEDGNSVSKMEVESQSQENEQAAADVSICVESASCSPRELNGPESESCEEGLSGWSPRDSEEPLSNASDKNCEEPTVNGDEEL